MNGEEGRSVEPGGAGAESVGEARMELDGTVHLRLRALGGGAVGDAQVDYPPGHPQYRAILDHLGGLEPGQEKPVRPWGEAP